jgi:hypothetical protein
MKPVIFAMIMSLLVGVGALAGVIPISMATSEIAHAGPTP